MGKQFTYSGDPSRSTRDEVRFLIGDTIKSRPLFDDREVDYQLTKTPNPQIAGARLLYAKAAEYARQADIRVGDVSKAFSKVSEAMKKCAAELEREALKLAKPFFGGLTKAGKRALAQQTDDVQPQFLIGQNDDPGVVQLNKDVATLWNLVGANAGF